VVRPFKGARPDHGQESESSSGEHEQTDDDDEFIVDDDEHGVLTTQLPMEYSLQTHQDLAHHFKIICQLFVHMAVRSASDRRPFMKKMLESMHVHCRSTDSANADCSAAIFLRPTPGSTTKIIWDERLSGHILGLETSIQEAARKIPQIRISTNEVQRSSV
jgi:hypothetical protein